MKLLRKLALLCAIGALATAPAIYAADAAAPKPPKADPKAALIDINTATAEQLQTLEGIAEARSAAIIKGRPYTKKDQIMSKAGIPQAIYDKIKDQIIAKQPGKDKADKPAKKGGDKKGGDKKGGGKKGQDKPDQPAE